MGGLRLQAATLQQLGAIAHKRGEYRRATALVEECVGLTREGGDRHPGRQMGSRRWARWRRRKGTMSGRAATSGTASACTAIWATAAMWPRCWGKWPRWRSGASKDPGGAPVGAAAALRAAIGAPLTAGREADLERAVAPVRAGCSEAEFRAAWVAGEALSLEQAVAEALASD